MIARRPGSSGNSRAELVEPGRADLVHRAASRRSARCAGAPLNAHAISVMRPLSRRCAIVSTPLPVRSRYATRVGAEDPQRVETLGREVDVPVARRSARSRRRTSAARAHHCARSSEMDAKRSATTPVSQPAVRRQPIDSLAGVVARPHERARLDVREAERLARRPGSRRTRPASTSGATGQVLARVGRRYWPSVTMSTPTARRSASAARTSSAVSPMPRIRPDFVTRPASLARPSTDERARVAGRRTRRALEPGDGLEVVVQHVGPGREDRRRATRRRPCSRRSAARPRSPGSRRGPRRPSPRTPTRRRRAGRRARRT